MEQSEICFSVGRSREIPLLLAMATTFEYSSHSTADLALDESRSANVVCQSITRFATTQRYDLLHGFIGRTILHFTTSRRFLLERFSHLSLCAPFAGISRNKDFTSTVEWFRARKRICESWEEDRRYFVFLVLFIANLSHVLSCTQNLDNEWCRILLSIFVLSILSSKINVKSVRYFVAPMHVHAVVFLFFLFEIVTFVKSKIYESRRLLLSSGAARRNFMAFAPSFVAKFARFR